MGWLTFFEAFAPATSLTRRQITIVVAATLCGLSSIAYVVFLRKSNEGKQKRMKKPKWNSIPQLESEVMSNLRKVKDRMGEESRNETIIEKQAVVDLLVTMDQLEDLLEDLAELELVALNNESVLAVKQHLNSLNTVVAKVLGKTRKKALKAQKIQRVKSREHLVSIKSNQEMVMQSDVVDGDDYHSDSSSDESFVSAAESLPEEIFFEKDLVYDKEINDLFVQFGHLDFYREGIEEYNKQGIDVRKLRTEMLGCLNDTDFRVKVYCIRNAFKILFQEDKHKEWFLETGHKMLVDFLMAAGKSTHEFERDFRVLVDYCQDKKSWDDIEEELTSRKVCCMSFYDIVLDFVVMDSFDDLENPPYALTSVIQNGWISNSIKESALAAAVWSLLTAKVRMLQNPNAFLAKFYQLSQQLTPVLVWGFLGPDGTLKDACHAFQALLLGFLQEIFSVHHCNYNTITTLADDILENAKRRISQK